MGFLKRIMSSPRENIESLQFIVTIQTNNSYYIFIQIQLNSLTSTNELVIQKQKTHVSIFLYVASPQNVFKSVGFWALKKHDWFRLSTC